MPEPIAILIVDDDRGGREALEALLLTQGYRMILASNGTEALQKVVEKLPDLVLLDVMMPGMDGYEVCRRIRSDPKVADIPVLMLTALSDYRSRLAGFEAGADDYITKPYDSAELFARVRTVSRLNRYRRLLTERLKFQQLFDLSPNGQALLDRKSVIRLANEAMARLVDPSGAVELVGENMLDWVQDEREEAMQSTLQALWNEPKQQRLETWLAGKDGLLQPVEVFLSRLDLGGQEMAHLIAIDIREKLQITGALAKERNILKSFLEMTQDYFYCKDLASKYILANPALAGLVGATNPEEMSGKTDFDFFPRELAVRYFSDEQNLLQLGKPIESQEEPVVDSQGKQHILLTIKRPLKNHRGYVMGLVGIGRDITAQKNALAELQVLQGGQGEIQSQVQELKERLAETSRQAAQFLQAACGLLASALDGELSIAPGEDKAQAGASAFGQKESMNEPGFGIQLLLSELKDYAALQTSTFQVKTQEMDVLECVNELCRWARSQAEKRQLGLRITLDEKLPVRLRADFGRLSKALYNYFQFAITQVQAGEVAAVLEFENHHPYPTPKAAHLHFLIRFTGQGVGAPGIGSIFEVQADGKGIGLALCRRLVEAVGGAVWAESKEPGPETILHFTFPVSMP